MLKSILDYEGLEKFIMIERARYLCQLSSFKDKHVIKVISGVRRCGKSTLFVMYQDYLLAQGVKKGQIINLNLEDGANRHLLEADALFEFVVKKLQKQVKNYVFLDEIQNVNDWQKVVDWLYVREDVDLYITGSNAFLLSGELATLLSGRYVEIKMLPLSFKEYVSSYTENLNKQELYARYLMQSSFPGALEFEGDEEIRAYLEGIYNTVLFKDVVMREKIADASSLESVLSFCMDNIGNITSPNKIANTMSSYGRKISLPTVERYLQALVKAFILYRVDRYDVKGKQILQGQSKYYAVDMGIRNYRLGYHQRDAGHILENVVYLELLRRGYAVHVGKLETGEIDFVATKGEEIVYYQVALSIMDENVLQRELLPLQKLKDHYAKYLLTLDYLPRTSYDGIYQLNVLDWLLQ